jgi:hypothetical protein
MDGRPYRIIIIFLRFYLLEGKGVPQQGPCYQT